MKLVDVHVHVVETLHGFARRGEFRAIGGGRARWANGEETALIPPELGEYDVRGERLYPFLMAQALGMLRLPNVWFDISAVPWNVDPEVYPYPTAVRYVAMARDTVGHDKLLWGSDLPSPLTRDSYVHLWDYLQTGKLFDEGELQDIYYNNAFNAYPLS